MRRTVARRLTKSSNERMIFGVAGGLAEYFDVDPVLVRVVFALLVLSTGVGLVAYVVLAIVMPSQASVAARPGDVVRENVEQMPGDVSRAGRRLEGVFRGEVDAGRSGVANRGRYLAGVVLIVVGGLLLAANFGWLGWFSWLKLWPLLVVAAGVIVVMGRARREE